MDGASQEQQHDSSASVNTLNFMVVVPDPTGVSDEMYLGPFPVPIPPYATVRHLKEEIFHIEVHGKNIPIDFQRLVIVYQEEDRQSTEELQEISQDGEERTLASYGLACQEGETVFLYVGRSETGGEADHGDDGRGVDVGGGSDGAGDTVSHSVSATSHSHRDNTIDHHGGGAVGQGSGSVRQSGVTVRQGGGGIVDVGGSSGTQRGSGAFGRGGGATADDGGGISHSRDIIGHHGGGAVEHGVAIIVHNDGVVVQSDGGSGSGGGAIVNRGSGGTAPKTSTQRWSASDIDALLNGVERHGLGQWKLIVEEYGLRFDNSQARTKWLSLARNVIADTKPRVVTLTDAQREQIGRLAILYPPT